SSSGAARGAPVLPSGDLVPLLGRIADALERLAPPAPAPVDLSAAAVFVWAADRGRLEPVPEVNRVPLDLLKGIERQRDTLFANTQRFARGLPANNATLWGARGTGKSSLVKAVHAAVNEAALEGEYEPVALVEIHREDLP